MYNIVKLNMSTKIKKYSVLKKDKISENLHRVNMSLYDDDDDIVKEKESQVAGWSQVKI